jgi:hypothetical protein
MGEPLSAPICLPEARGSLPAYFYLAGRRREACQRTFHPARRCREACQRTFYPARRCREACQRTFCLAGSSREAFQRTFYVAGSMANRVWPAVAYWNKKEMPLRSISRCDCRCNVSYKPYFDQLPRASSAVFTVSSSALITWKYSEVSQSF